MLPAYDTGVAIRAVAKGVRALAWAAIVAIATGCSTGPQRESLGEYVDDSVTTSKVKSAILADPQLHALEIHVDSYRGVVQLSGFVDSQAVISRASEVVRHVDGVRMVKNDLRAKGAP